jgi:hypothetical protein
MDSSDAIKLGLDMAEYVSMAYLEDLTDADLMHRPCVGANHIAWQLGHLVSSEHQLVEMVKPGSMPPLPAGFAERFTKVTATSDDPSQFLPKADVLRVAREQRAGTLAALRTLNDADLERPSGVDYAPTVAGIFSLQGSHWMMHAGQWAIVRRQLGRPPLF